MMTTPYSATTETGFAHLQETLAKAYQRAATIDDTALTMRLNIALTELEDLRCRMIGISSTLDALDEATDGEPIVFIRPRD